MTECAICEQPVAAGERLVSWFTKNEHNDTTERGAVHLACLTPVHAQGGQ